MPPRVAPSPARHARIFELIRQSNQAELTSARLTSASTESADQTSLEDWCTSAIRSLRLDGALSGT